MWFDEDCDRGDWCEMAPLSAEQKLAREVREWVNEYPPDDYNVGKLGRWRVGCESPFRAHEDHRASWLALLPPPETVEIRRRVLILRRPPTPGTPAHDITVDANREERERWVAWAKRRHPEWGENPKTPRRLAPRWVVGHVEATEPREAGLIVLVVHRDYQDWARFSIKDIHHFGHVYITRSEGASREMFYGLDPKDGWTLVDKWVTIPTSGPGSANAETLRSDPTPTSAKPSFS